MIPFRDHSLGFYFGAHEHQIENTWARYKAIGEQVAQAPRGSVSCLEGPNEKTMKQISRIKGVNSANFWSGF